MLKDSSHYPGDRRRALKAVITVPHGALAMAYHHDMIRATSPHYVSHFKFLRFTPYQFSLTFALLTSEPTSRFSLFISKYCLFSVDISLNHPSLLGTIHSKVSMSTPKLSGPGARRSGPRHPWSQDQKLFLYILNTDFQWTISWEQRARLFNSVFRNEINQADFPHGLPPNKLSAQYGERQKKTNASWAAITRPVASEEESAKRNKIANQIEQAALSLGLDGELGVASAMALPSRRKASLPKRRRNSVATGRESLVGANLATTASHRPYRILRRDPVVVIRRSEQRLESDITPITATNAAIAPRTPRSCINASAPVTPPKTVRLKRRLGPHLDLPAAKYHKIPLG